MMPSKLSRFITITTLMGALLALQFPAQAEVFKWKDEKGEIHYSQFPPDKQKATQIKVHTGTPDNSTQKALEKAVSKNEKEKKAREEVTKKQETEAEKLANRKKFCAEMQSNMNSLMTQRRVARKVNGKLVEIGAEEREKEIQSLRQKIKEVCSDL